MRAASYGIPFQPILGLNGSDLPRENKWKKVQDPYSEGEIYVIPKIQPDVAIIHASEVDEEGNVRIDGTPYWDRIMSRAARRVLVTAEKVVPHEKFIEEPNRTLIPGFMVEAIAISPKGAWPGTCFLHYDVDHEEIKNYLEGEISLNDHLNKAPEIKNREVAINA